MRSALCYNVCCYIWFSVFAERLLDGGVSHNGIVSYYRKVLGKTKKQKQFLSCLKKRERENDRNRCDYDDTIIIIIVYTIAVSRVCCWWIVAYDSSRASHKTARRCCRRTVGGGDELTRRFSRGIQSRAFVVCPRPRRLSTPGLVMMHTQRPRW